MITKKYTMVEMLAVIAVIAILIGIAIPSVGYARKRASITQAKADIANLVTAIKAYESTYHLLPVATATSQSGTVIYDTDSTTKKDAYDELIERLTTENTRKIKFLELPQDAETLVDPFKSEDFPHGSRYTIILNSSYNADGVTFDGKTLRGNVFVYSWGPDGINDNGDPQSDDITSWDNK